MIEPKGYPFINVNEIPYQEISDPAVMSKSPLVSVFTTTYNHEPYIVQAIEGVLMQKTDFPIELVIGEDCSTDRTRAIVFDYQKKRPDIIRVITSEQNVGARKNGYRTEKACRGKYIAFCDGDDYWHHSKKLQKQVEYLEAHPDVGLVHSDYDRLIEKTGEVMKSIHNSRGTNIPVENCFDELLVGNFIATVTVCARTSLVKQVFADIGEKHKDWMMMDYVLWLEISRHVKIGYINESLGVHRKLPESAMHTANKKKRFNFLKSSYDIRFHFVKKYGCPPHVQATVLRQYHRMMLRFSFLLHQKENTRQSFKFLMRAENDQKQKKKNYYYYLGSKNNLNWILLRVFLKIKEQMRGRFGGRLE